MATSHIEWAWCLDLFQSFGALLDVARSLVTGTPRPGEREETGGLLLNLYLVVCALDQVLSDRLHRGFYDLTQIRVRGAAHYALLGASRAQRVVRSRTAVLREGRLQRRERELLSLASTLAHCILNGQSTPARDIAEAVFRLRRTRWPQSLRRARLRVPESFRGEALYPADCELLAARASEAEGSLKTPVVVIGLRTAGLYIAPLCAAALRRLGHVDVGLMSLRPGVPLLRSEVKQVRQLAAGDGWVLIVEGSSRNGVAFARAIAALAELGVSEARICLAAPAIADPGDAGWPGLGDVLSPIELPAMRQSIERARHVALVPGEEYVREVLDDEAVERWLNRPQMLVRLGADAAAVLRGHPESSREAVPGMTIRPMAIGLRRREHGYVQKWKLFEVELRRQKEVWVDLVLGRAVGVGFFGYHSWLVAACLSDHTPEVLGIHDGILFWRWEEGQGPPEPVEPEELDEIAGYVAARARRLELAGQPRPSADAASSGARRIARLMTRTMRGGVLVEPWVMEVLDRSVTAARGAVVDGWMGPAAWIRSDRGGLLKRDIERHDHDVTEGRVVDPAHDLAAAVIEFRLEPDEERRLVNAYLRLTGDSPYIAARLAVHKLQAGLAELEAVASPSSDPPVEGRRAFARELVIRETMLTRTVNGYLSDLHLPRPASDAMGAAWLLRLEGVLETNRLGFESVTPAAMTALRALLAHGHQVFLATSHSLGELREQCRAFGLPGGVAEHGAVIWDEGHQEVSSLLDDQATAALAKLRDLVLLETDVLVDPRPQYSLLLFRHGEGQRRGVNGDEVRTLMARHGIKGLEVVEGPQGTAVRAAGIDGVSACERLSARLTARSSRTQLHVVAGGRGDIGLFRLADTRYTSASARNGVTGPGVGLQIRVASLPNQAGFLRLVQHTLHGWRRTCRLCAPATLAGADAALSALLGLQDRSSWRHLTLILRFASGQALERGRM